MRCLNARQEVNSCVTVVYNLSFSYKRRPLSPAEQFHCQWQRPIHCCKPRAGPKIKRSQFRSSAILCTDGVSTLRMRGLKPVFDYTSCMACVYYESIICCFVMQFQRSETASVGRDKLGVLGSPLRCNRSVVPLSLPSLSVTVIKCYVHVRSPPPPPRYCQSTDPYKAVTCNPSIVPLAFN